MAFCCCEMCLAENVWWKRILAFPRRLAVVALCVLGWNVCWYTIIISFFAVAHFSEENSKKSYIVENSNSSKTYRMKIGKRKLDYVSFCTWCLHRCWCCKSKDELFVGLFYAFNAFTTMFFACVAKLLLYLD